MAHHHRETNEERWARLEEEELEQNRLASRSLWQKINDADSVHDIKALLHEIVDELDTALASRGGFPPQSK